MEIQNITLRLSCPTHDKLCFDSSLFPFVFYLEKFKTEQDAILNGEKQEISVNFRLLMYLLSRNHYLFDTNHLYDELISFSQKSPSNESVYSILENHLEDAILNLETYLKELILEGYLDYIFVKDSSIDD